MPIDSEFSHQKSMVIFHSFLYVYQRVYPNHHLVGLIVDLGAIWAIIGGLNRLHQRGKAPQPTNAEGMNIRRSSIPAKLGVIPQKDRNFERPFTKIYISIFWKNPGSYFENHLKRILGSQVTTPTVFKRRWSIGDWKKWHQWFSARRLDTSRYLHSPWRVWSQKWWRLMVIWDDLSNQFYADVMGFHQRKKWWHLMLEIHPYSRWR